MLYLVLVDDLYPQVDTLLRLEGYYIEVAGTASGPYPGTTPRIHRYGSYPETTRHIPGQRPVSADNAPYPGIMGRIHGYGPYLRTTACIPGQRAVSADRPRIPGQRPVSRDYGPV